MISFLNMMQLTKKLTNKIQTTYTLEGTVLENVENIKYMYLGVTITSDLTWNTHISNICTKAIKTLGFLRQTLFSCPQDVKEAAYKGMVHPAGCIQSWCIEAEFGILILINFKMN